jgi:hypothetical protein
VGTWEPCSSARRCDSPARDEAPGGSGPAYLRQSGHHGALARRRWMVFMWARRVAVGERVLDLVRADFEPGERVVATLAKAVVRVDWWRVGLRDRRAVVVTDRRVFIAACTRARSHWLVLRYSPSAVSASYQREDVHVVRYKHGFASWGLYGGWENALLDLSLPGDEIMRLKVTSQWLWPSAHSVAEALSRHA